MGRTNWYELHARGWKAFNKWRVEHPRARPNFSGMNFDDETSFSQYDLRGANLRDGSFPRASFSGADLRGADLSNAYLGYGNFNRADLRGTVLRYVDLRNASLTSTKLENADLSGADLRATNVTGAIVGETNFSNADLSSIIGGTRIEHTADSTIDVATLYRSNGHILDAFLRGAGVPKKTIAHVHDLSKRTQKQRSAFLSHSSQDEKVAKTLLDDLQSANVKCFYAPYDLHAGESFPDKIHKEIEAAGAFIVLLSKNSLASTWVEREYEAAIEARNDGNSDLKVIPVRLDAEIIKQKNLPAWSESLKSSTHVLNLSAARRGNGYWRALDELIEAIGE